jgi:hypothetical protein
MKNITPPGQATSCPASCLPPSDALTICRHWNKAGQVLWMVG